MIRRSRQTSTLINHMVASAGLLAIVFPPRSGVMASAKYRARDGGVSQTSNFVRNRDESYELRLNNSIERDA